MDRSGFAWPVGLVPRQRRAPARVIQPARGQVGEQAAHNFHRLLRVMNCTGLKRVPAKAMLTQSLRSSPYVEIGSLQNQVNEVLWE